MTLITTHRGICITQAEVPAAPFEWIHDETDTHGTADTLHAARRQINTLFRSADPSCEMCSGTGYTDWFYLALEACPVCCQREASHE